MLIRYLTHAEEVGKGVFSGIVLVGPAVRNGETIRVPIASEQLKVEVSDDLIGVQLCAALKNILAVFIGILDGKN